MTKKRKFLSLLLCLILVLTSSAFAAEPTLVIKQYDINHFEYPVTPDDPEWADFTTKQEMIDAISIPDKVLKRMTTEALIDAVLNFPLSMNLFVYNNFDDARKAFSSDSDAYRELLTRKDAGDLINSRLNTDFSTADYSTDVSSFKMKLQCTTLEVLLRDDRMPFVNQSIKRSLVPDNRRSIFTPDNGQIVTPDMGPVLGTATTYTPKGNTVTVNRCGEFSAAEITRVNAEVQRQWPNATMISSASGVYNCHNYAWNTYNGGTSYWMLDPTKYMSDGSYRQVTGLPKKGNRIYYGSKLHSGIINSDPVPPYAYDTVSKWGDYPLMRHAYRNCPYDTSNITFWEAA